MPALRRQLWILLFATCTALFLIAPWLDLWVSRQFYDARHGFYLRHAAVPEFSYHFVNRASDIVLYGLIALLLLSLTTFGKALHPHRRMFIYLLLVLLLGPGLLVNGVLKNHWGRARPEAVQEFGGAARFTPAWWPSRECAKNCAFVSGHAAFGFYFVSFGFALPRRRRTWLAAGIATGGFVGMMRVVQGAHFLSDVVFAFFVVYATAAITYDLVCRRERRDAMA